MSKKSFDKELEFSLREISHHEKNIAKMLSGLDIEQYNLYKYAIYMCRLRNDFHIERYLAVYKEHNFGRCNRF